MVKLSKLKKIFFNKKRKLRKKQSEENSILGTMPFKKETDYKIEKYSPLAYPLGENKSLGDENIKEAIHNIPDISDEVEIKQMSKTDFYQLSYMDCLPNKRIKKLIKQKRD